VTDICSGTPQDDDVVWEYAAKHGFMIVSKDADFHQWSFVHGHPPKVVWIRHGNCSTADVTFYVPEYNGEIPHSAFRGQTPDEVYYDCGERIPIEIEAARRAARVRRLATNRGATCRRCTSKSEVAA